MIPFLDIGDGVHERARAVCDLQQQRFNPTLFVFPYDWRLSNAENSAGSNSISTVSGSFIPDRRIDILAHSMGGLIARRYILDNPTNHHIDKMVTIGTPGWVRRRLHTFCRREILFG